jgi:hypothetical protein
MGFFDAFTDAANRVVGGGPNQNQRLAEAWHRLARSAKNPQAREAYEKAAQLLWEGKEGKAQRLFDEAAQLNARRDLNQAAKAARRGPGESPVSRPQGNEEDGIVEPGGPDEDVYDGEDYVSMLREQLGRARGAVEQQFAAAYGDIAAREGAFAPVMAALPQQLNDRFAATGQSMKGTLEGMVAAQNASGLTQLMPTAATMAPHEVALAQELAAHQASADFTKMGVEQMFGNQRADLNQQKMAALADIAGQEDSMLASAMENERDRQFRARQALMEDIEGARTGYGAREVSVGRGGDMILSETNPEWHGLGKTQFAPGKAQAIRSGSDARSATYRKTNKMLSQVQNAKQLAAAMQMLQKKAKYNRRPNAASLALADSGLTGLYGGK